MPRRLPRPVLLSVVALVAALVAGCGAASEPAAVAPQVDGASTVQLAFAPAEGKPIVMLEGLVNGGKPMPADMASFNALPKQTLTVTEPFVKKSMTFTGVAFADLLNAAQATGTSVTVHALDDYEVTYKAALLRDQGVLLATRVDGKAIEVASGGPVRMVFPGTSKAGKDTDLWVWSIDKITVE